MSGSRLRKGLLLLTSAATLGWGQTSIHLPSQAKQADFSGAPVTKPARVVTALPASCASGEVVGLAGGTADGLYYCTSAGIWIAAAAHGHTLGQLSGVTGKQGSGSLLQAFGSGTATPGQCAAFDAEGNLMSQPCSATAQTNYSQTFTMQSGVTLNHGTNNQNVIVSCYDEANQQVSGNTVTVLDANNVAVTFATPQTGRCVVNSTGGGNINGDGTVVSNSGTGAMVLKSGTNVTARTLKAGSNVTITAGADEVTISAAGGTGVGSINSQSGTAQTVAGSSFVTVTSTSNTHTIAVANTQGNGARLVTSAAAPADGCASWSGGTLTSVGAPCGSGSGGGGTAGTGITIADGAVSVNGAVVPSYLTGVASLTFAGFGGTGNCEEQNITVAGAAAGDGVSLGLPQALPAGIIQGAAWVSTANTVTVRMCRLAGAGTIAALTFRAWINKTF